MEDGRSARIAPVVYVGTVLGALALAALALHVDPRGTVRSLAALFAAAVVLGLPLAVALAAFRRAHVPLIGLATCCALALWLLTLAVASSSSLRATIGQARLSWLSFSILFTLSLAFATGLAASRAKRSIAVVVPGLVLTLIGLVILARDSLPDFEISMEEDGWVEWTTFYVFLGAAWVYFGISRRSFRSWRRSDPALQALGKLLVVGAGVVCLFVAAEEISWGQRIFGFRPPDVFSELNYQQEMNVHNFFRGKQVWNVPLDSRYLVVYLSLLFGFVLPLAAALATRRGGGTPASRLAPSPYLAPCFGLVGLAELTYPIPMTGEAAELLLGSVFLVDALSRQAVEAAPVPTVKSLRALAAAASLPLLAGVATPWVAAVFAQRGSAAAVAETREDLALLRDDLMLPGAIAGLLEQEGVHKRLFTARSRDYLQLGEDSYFMTGGASAAERPSNGEPADRRRYFLDPWNGAYWIRYKRGRPVLLLYSFGPNRRRDTDFGAMEDEQWLAAIVGGDDLAIAVPLAPDGG